MEMEERLRTLHHEARFWRETVARLSMLAIGAADAVQTREKPLEHTLFVLGQIAEGAARPAAGVMSLKYLGDEALSSRPTPASAHTDATKEPHSANPHS